VVVPLNDDDDWVGGEDEEEEGAPDYEDEGDNEMLE
jgi:hypothetical protein